MHAPEGPGAGQAHVPLVLRDLPPDGTGCVLLAHLTACDVPPELPQDVRASCSQWDDAGNTPRCLRIRVPCHKNSLVRISSDYFAV